MDISFNRKIKTPIYLQIKNQIIDKIISGEWENGFILPSERELSNILDVNRSTVNKAYWELKADGFISSKVGSGTIVDKQNGDYDSVSDRFIREIRWENMMCDFHETKNSRAIKTAMKCAADSGITSFAGGFVGSENLPVDIVKKISSECFEKYGSKMLSPSNILGVEPLREEICRHMFNKGIRCSVNECMILSGSQQGIDFFARTFISPGDVVFMESPTYIGAIDIFKSYGAKVIGIPIDEGGMRMDILESYLLRFKPKFIYTIPTYQNPSGTTMTLERRYKLLELAYSNEIPILEDDPYSDISFESRRFPPLKAIDRYGYVAYLSTFSKKFYMGGRIGWIACSKEIVKRFGELKQLTDLHANTVNQYFLLEVLKKNLVEEYLEILIREILGKRDLMMEELFKRGIPAGCFSVPKGGLYLWLRIDGDISMGSFLDNCRKERVAVMPGDAFFPNGFGDASYIRLNYSYPKKELIPEGVRRIVNSLDEAVKNKFKETNYPNSPIV